MTRTNPSGGRFGDVALAILALAVLALSGCAERAQPPPSTPEVSTIEIRSERVVLTKETPGRTCARMVAEIRPQASGIIQERLFAEGAAVEAGDVLYKIAPETYEAAVANAEAAVAAATANYETALAAREAAKAALLEEPLFG